MTLPKDPVMLLSAVNMKLRDQYRTLDALCEDMDVSRSEVERVLGEIGYEYDEKQCRFV